MKYMCKLKGYNKLQISNKLLEILYNGCFFKIQFKLLNHCHSSSRSSTVLVVIIIIITKLKLRFLFKIDKSNCEF